MTMVSSGPISLGGNATTPASGPGTQTYSFVVDTYLTTTIGYIPAIYTSQTISPSNATLVGGGTTIQAIAYNLSNNQLILSVNGATNSPAWVAMIINGTPFLKSATTYVLSGGVATWTWTNVYTNPMTATGTLTTVSFQAVAGVGINLNQSVELELINTYGNPLGTSTISLNDPAVRTLAGISSGTISLSNLYGKTAPFVYSYTLPVGSYSTNFNLEIALFEAGWNGITPIIATVIINGVLGAIDTTGYAFATGSGYPSGSTITVTVGPNGFITGAGGGTATGASENGGNAMHLQSAIILNNNGIIQGGGGTGNGGDNDYNGAGCGYQVNTSYEIGTPPIGRMPKLGSSPYIIPVGGLTSDPLGPTAGYDVTSSGEITSGSAQIYATLESGGSYARNTTNGSNNGGSGGSWVAGTAETTSSGTYVYSPVLGGGGYGSTSPGTGEGTTNVAGIFGPGHSIDGVSYITNGINGIIRGATT